MASCVFRCLWLSVRRCMAGVFVLLLVYFCFCCGFWASQNVVWLNIKCLNYGLLASYASQNVFC